MSTQFQRAYGLTNNWFVCRKPNSESVIIGGDGDNSARWTRVLSQRAATVLWYQLGNDLFPTRFNALSPQLNTLGFRSAKLPTITTELHVERLQSGDFEITGANGDLRWMAMVTTHHAGSFWSELNTVLGIETDITINPDENDVIRLD